MTFNSAFVDRSSSSSENNFEVLNFDSDGEFTSVRRNYEISTEGSREFVEGDIRRRLRCGLLNEQDSGHPGSVDRVGEEILQTRSGSSYNRNNINAIIQETLSETQFECEENSEYQEVEESEFSERDYSIDGLPVDTVTREEGEYVPRITAVDLGNWRYRPTVTSVSSVDSSSRTESQGSTAQENDINMDRSNRERTQSNAGRRLFEVVFSMFQRILLKAVILHEIYKLPDGKGRFRHLSRYVRKAFSNGFCVISEHGDHANVVHDCAYSSHQCRCKFIKDLTQHYGSRLGRRLVRRTDFTVKYCCSALHYLSKIPRQIGYLQIGREQFTHAHFKNRYHALFRMCKDFRY